MIEETGYRRYCILGLSVVKTKWPTVPTSFYILQTSICSMATLHNAPIFHGFLHAHNDVYMHDNDVEISVREHPYDRFSVPYPVSLGLKLMGVPSMSDTTP